MKLVVAWLCVLALTALGAGSCSINHKSGDFECTKQSDCSGGRTCTGGYCVFPGGTVDAPKGDALLDAPKDGNPDVCPNQCTSCDQGTHTCKIDCAVTSCNGAVVCPVGWNCDVACSTANSCRGGVTCTGTGTCKIGCTGSNSCRDLQCGTGKCDINCAGSGSCRGVTCNPSCGCDVKCAPGVASCESVLCTGVQCDTGLGCSSMIVSSCETCP
jgi:hypothetical protein